MNVQQEIIVQQEVQVEQQINVLMEHIDLM